MAASKKVKKNISSETVGNLALIKEGIAEQADTKRRKNKVKINDSVITDYLKNAEKGEKKTEAGIKYWFEQSIKGHVTEDTTAIGAPDGYTAGWLVLELKSKNSEWLEAFFQGISRKELSYKYLVVATHNLLQIFPGIHHDTSQWRSKKKKAWSKILQEAHESDESPSKIGKRLAKKYKNSKDIFSDFLIFEWSPDAPLSLFKTYQTEKEALASFKNILTSFDPHKARVYITPKNFSLILKSLIPFFNEDQNKRFEVVHGFYRCLDYINPDYIPVLSKDPAESDRVYLGGGYFEGLKPESRKSFIRTLQRYIVKNPNVNHYFAKYDVAIDTVDPAYRANHGIYFTNEYLARLAISIAEKHFGDLSSKYIVFDPACGSGNLVTSWNHHLDLRHKVVSEISPILLKAFELRFSNHSSERRRGFTIIPKTNSGRGLNFVDIPAETYLDRINTELKDSGHRLNKPLAVICNPPYRNRKNIKDEFYKYEIDDSIVDIIGKDGAKELFNCFLAQISEVCRLAEENEFPSDSIVLLFTKTTWITEKSSYKLVKDHFLHKFNLIEGFVVDSREFFDVKKSWPLMVTLWKFSPKKKLDSGRRIALRNFLELRKQDLKRLVNDTETEYDDLSNWGNDQVFGKRLERLLKKVEREPVAYNVKIKKLKDMIPPQAGDGNKQITLAMIKDKRVMGGLCFASEDQVAKRTELFTKKIAPVVEENEDLPKKGKKKKKIPSFVVFGDPLGSNIGFTEGKQPFRTNRTYENDGKRLFFLMDTRFIKMKTSQVFSGVPPKRGHVLETLNEEGRNLIIGYAIAQTCFNSYPVQFDHYNMWVPEGSKEKIRQLFECCCAFLYAHNSCVECEIPAGEPYKGGRRVFVCNPLAPQRGTFWTSKIKPLVKNTDIQEAECLITLIDKIYKRWKKFLDNNPNYESKRDIPINLHSSNRKPLDGWGILQIESEVKTGIDNKLTTLFDERKRSIGIVKDKIKALLGEIDYWSV